MAIPGQNAELFRRIRLYLVGFVLGLILVGFIYKGRGCKMPSSVKLEELCAQQKIYSEKAKCQLQCLAITESKLNQSLENGKINYDESDVRKEPYGYYTIESVLEAKDSIKVLIEDKDSVSSIVSLNHPALKEKGCDCK